MSGFIIASLWALSAMPVSGANPDSGLRIEVRASPNFVVDSNVESPSTYAPRSAYICAKVYNDGTTDLADVFVNIGDYVNNTPGIYPARSQTNLTGTFSFTHEGGSAGADDAVRYIGTLPAGDVATVYWLISYPNLDDLGNAVHGPSVKPDDDLYLFYDVWAVAKDGPTLRAANVRKKATMRNEISALANKIWPNTASKVAPELKEAYGVYEPTWTNTVLTGGPGAPITASGIWFDLGNVEKGFDNDGFGGPDQNAWLQPVGDPSIFDSSVYRLVETHATIWVSEIDGTLRRYDLDDDLYLSGIPKNNGAVGIVNYTFMPMVGNGSGTLSPYQEVASGFDNEKFNGDYGTQVELPPPGESKVALVKEVDKAFAWSPDTLSYTVDFTNAGEVAVGDPDLYVPLVVQDSVPPGTVYAGGAETGNTLPSGVASYTTLYSTNNGVSWLTSAPTPLSDVTDLQWWLSDPLPTGTAGRVTFQLDVEYPYTPTTNLIVNVAGLSFGSSAPFLEDDAVTVVLGTNTIGDTVFLDDGSGSGFSGDGLQWGSEPGISNISVKLYYDLDTDGTLDASDYYVASTITDTAGWYSFTNLPDGHFVVQVAEWDTDLPQGAAITTPRFYAVDLDSGGTNITGVSFLDADFGFVPAIGLDKILMGPVTNYEGDAVSFQIVAANQLDGYAGRAVYDTWATSNTPASKPWVNASNAWSSPSGPDGLAAYNLIEAPAQTMELQELSISDPFGDVTSVYLHMSMWATGQVSWTSESIDIEIRDSGTPIFSTNLLGSAITNTLENSDWLVDVSTNKTWQWSDFNSNNISIYIAATKSGQPDDGTIFLDAAGFRVISDWTSSSNNPSTTLDPVPLTDTFDADVLEYVSASPAPASVSISGSSPDTVGTLTWADVGPLYASGYESITVNFTALEPAGNAEQTTTNTAFVRDVFYADGRPANSATDQVAVVILPTGIIGDYVWRDINSDGLPSGGGEVGIPGVSVVCAPPVGVDIGNGAGNPVTNVTDASGYYFFGGIPGSGDFTVSVIESTLPGGSGTCTYDEDSGTVSPDSSTIVTNFTFDATDGSDRHLSADFGYVDVVATIDGTVWNDLNRNGATSPDTGEPWLTNVIVVLYQGATPIDTNTTDTSGYFQFTGSFNGSYTIQANDNTGEMISGTWTPSFDTDGTATVSEVAVTVPAGGYGRGDFSYYQTDIYDIGDTLFYDWDGNGTNDVGEPGVPNVNMYLYLDIDTNGVLDAGIDILMMTDVTDASGTYLFESIFPASYIVEVDRVDADVPEHFTFTADPSGQNDGISYLTIVAASNLDQDFGIQPWGDGEIGDKVWKDVNADGLQSSSEPGISNVTVSLYWVDGSVTSLYETTSTDSTGWYLFENLPDGDYVSAVDTNDTDLPIDFSGNKYYPSTPSEISATITNSSSYLDADFGFTSRGAIGDTIFWDANRNGELDPSEDGVEGVTVSLYIDANTNGLHDDGETLYGTQVTTTNGFYLFDALLANAYAVEVTTTTGPLAGRELTADPSPESMDSQHGVELGLGDSYYGADFGYVPNGIIGDTLWLDMDSDGVRATGELGLAYITVELWDSSGFVTNTETDPDGLYLFMALPDNSYTVIVDTADADFPSGLTQTYDADGTLDDQTPAIVLSAGSMTTVNGSSFTNQLGIDFGYRYTGSNSLSGTIGMDSPTPDGLMGSGTSGCNADESPFKGEDVYVSLWNDDGDDIVQPGELIPLASTSTDTNGDYSFTGLPDGDGNDEYYVEYSPAAQDLSLTTLVGSRPVNVLSNGTDAAGHTIGAWQAVSITTEVTNVDFAFELTDDYDFGDLPDSYGTQYQDNGPRHILPGTPDLYLGATAPDAESNGQPSATAAGDDSAGTDDEDGVSLLGRWSEGPGGGSVEVTVGAGSGWLLGFVDFNSDGDLSDSGELIINQAVSNVVYTNTFTVPTGTFASTTSTVLYARFRLFESEPAGSAREWYVGSAKNGEVEDYAFGFSALGDYVWYDLDADGNQDAGEPPMTNVLVYIDENNNNTYDSSEPSDITDTNGLYSIVGLVAGTYTTRVDTADLPPLVFPSYDLDGTNTPHEALATVTTGEYKNDVDYGYTYGLIDVGVGKTVNDASPSNGVVVYTMVVTNYGPQVATGLKWIDNLPDGVVYYTNTTTTGTYDSTSGIWNVGTLAVDATETLTITASMAVDAGGQSITNWIYLNDLDQFDTNPTNNQDSAVIIPTYVILSRFEALNAGGQVVIEWETSAENMTVGFYLVRKEAGQLVRVNPELLPAVPGSQQGGIYSVTDPAAKPGEPMTYMLVEVEHSGIQNSYGPFRVMAPRTKGHVKSSTPEARGKGLAFAGMSVRAKSSPSYERRMERREANGSGRLKAAGRKLNINRDAWGIKMVTRDATALALSASQIADMTGMKTAQARGRLLNHELALRCRGEEIPYMVDAATATLLFYAEEYETTYTDKNAYLVTRGKGLSMPVLEGEAPPHGALVSYDESLHFEEDVHSVSALITDQDADSWMWDFFIGDNPSYSHQTYAFATHGVAAGDSKIVVRMQGASRTGVTGEHMVSVAVNGTTVGSASWTGLEPLDLEIALPAGLLVDGDNILELTASKAATAPYSVTYLNEFDITYPRSLSADEDMAVVRNAAAGPITIGGFASDVIRVWDISDSSQPVALAGVNAVNQMVSFNAEAEHDYIAFGSQGTGIPLKIEGVVLDELTARTNEADYVIITVSEFSAAVEPLAQYRAGLGLKVKTVMLEDIYNEFAYGIETPEAIKAFLSHSHARWARSPSYVVLVGEGTHDYKGHMGTGDNFVPPMLVKTAAPGMYASDNWFVDFDNDRLPEIPLGRLPGITSQEITSMVNKIIAYESAAAGNWQTHALLVADQSDRGGNFSGASDLLATHLPEDYDVTRAYLGKDNLEQTRETLLGALNSGAAFMNYFGHSGQDVLANERLLHISEVASLSNGSRLPVFMSLSCVAGRFDVPGADCISEELLLQQDGGCIAVWAPSGWSLNVLARVLAERFYDAVFEGGETVLGDAMIRAMRDYAAGPNDREMLVVYGLLGDPALRITGRPHAAYTVGLGRFERWQQRWGEAPRAAQKRLADPSADADGDNLTNWQEYLFGRNPFRHDNDNAGGLRIGRNERLPEQSTKPFDMEVVYERNKNVPVSSYVIETSEDMITWHDDNFHVSETIVTDNNDGLTETVLVRIKTRGKNRFFVRLRVQASE